MDQYFSNSLHLLVQGPRRVFLSEGTCNAPSVPVSKDLASEWLLGAESLDQLAKLDGGVWHPYRRKWATARKHHPLKDVAAAGGWKSEETLLRCYQQPDEATMLNVVMDGSVFRRRKA